MAIKLEGVDMTPIRLRNAALVPLMMSALSALLEFESRDIESYMRQNASWTDQTGNARNGLFARPYGENVSAGTSLHMGINLFHTVPYGIYLETRFSGKYAIIVPTIHAKGPGVLEDARGLIGRL